MYIHVADNRNKYWLSERPLQPHYRHSPIFQASRLSYISQNCLRFSINFKDSWVKDLIFLSYRPVLAAPFKDRFYKKKKHYFPLYFYLYRIQSLKQWIGPYPFVIGPSFYLFSCVGIWKYLEIFRTSLLPPLLYSCKLDRVVLLYTQERNFEGKVPVF